ncbi:MAG: DUF3783 domain-containing protein, partial [Erysipelotrichia bacterium]|nr:DUF3783 domain-containing protein [Erysipelotrichia bacterium]
MQQLIQIQRGFKMKEHALIYLGETQQYKQEIIALLKAFDFTYTFLDDGDLEKDVLSLFDKKDCETTINTRFPFNFIFFKNIDHDKIIEFYKQCANNGYPFSHKAIMTQHNQNWIMEDLLNEISEEHEFFKQWSLLNTLLQEANDCDETLYTEESYEAYKMAFIKAFMFKQQPKTDKAIIT